MQLNHINTQKFLTFQSNKKNSKKTNQKIFKLLQKTKNTDRILDFLYKNREDHTNIDQKLLNMMSKTHKTLPSNNYYQKKDKILDLKNPNIDSNKENILKFEEFRELRNSKLEVKKNSKKIPKIRIIKSKKKHKRNKTTPNQNYFFDLIKSTKNRKKSIHKKNTFEFCLNLANLKNNETWRSKTERNTSNRRILNSGQNVRQNKSKKKHILKGKRALKFQTIDCQKKRRSVQLKKSKDIWIEQKKSKKRLNKKKEFLFRVLKQTLKKGEEISLGKKLKKLESKNAQNKDQNENIHLSDILQTKRNTKKPFYLFEKSKSNFQMGFFVERLKSIYKRRIDGNSKILEHKAINRLQKIIRNNIFLFKKGKFLCLSFFSLEKRIWV